jgi:protein-S-isoprenylcysteine O-methyltransferase Ste14
VKIGVPVIALVGVVVGVLGFTYATSDLQVLGWFMIVAGFASAAVAVSFRVRQNRRLLRRWADEEDREQD